MQIEIKSQTVINAPASEVWNLLAHDFANIGRWATIIPDSRPDTTVSAPESGMIVGRAGQFDRVYGGRVVDGAKVDSSNRVYMVGYIVITREKCG